MIQEQKEQRQQQHQTHENDRTGGGNDTNDTNHGDIKEMIRILISNKQLPYKLLSEKDSKLAKVLFLLLVTLGGKDYVTREDFYLGEEFGNEEYGTLLHGAAKFNSCEKVMLWLIKVGGQKLVWEKDGGGRTLLHGVCSGNASINVLKTLIEIGGGRDFVWEKDEYGKTSIHYACYYNASFDVVKKLIEVGGGRDFVWEKDEDCMTSLHWACKRNVCSDVVKKLIEVGGGRDFVWEKDENGRNSLHIACYYNASVDVLDLLIEYGGRDLFTQFDNEGKSPLQLLISKYWYGEKEQKKSFIEKASLLINKGIELRIGGQYSIGGLFICNTNQEVQDRIYEHWDDNVLPALEQVMDVPHNRHLPILQALIINKAPPRIVKSAADAFTDSINTKDNFDKYPIDVAVDHGLSWNDGLEQIVKAFASEQHTTPFNVCTKHGVQWENGIRNALENKGCG